MTIPIDPELIAGGRRGKPEESAAPLPLSAEALFSRMPEAVLCCGRSGEFLYLNAAAERAFQQPAARLRGLRLWQLLPELVGKPFHQAFERVVQAGGHAQLDQYFATLGGWYAVSLYRVEEVVCVIARDVSAERQAQTRLEVLADASRAFAAAGLDLQSTFDTVARRLAELLGDTCIVRTLRPDGRAWESILGAYDRDPAIRRFAQGIPLLSPEDGFNGPVLRTRQPLLLERVDPERAAREHATPGYRPVLKRLRPHSVMVTPVLSGQRLLGTIAMCRRVGGNPRPYGRDDLVLLGELADRAAVAIVNAREHNTTRILEERLRLAVGAGQIGIWDFEPQSQRLSWDARCRQLYGLPEHAPGSLERFIGAVHPQDREAVRAAVQRALDGAGAGGLEIAYRVIGIGDGIERWLAASGRAFFAEGRLYRFTGTLLDISREKAAEREREQHLRELERRVHFSDMFAGILGHDLRNPLSAIATTAQLLCRRAPGERLRVPAERIVGTAQRMQRMIDQLLDFTRIRLGGGLPLSRQPLDLALLCRQVADELVSSGTHNPLQLVSEGDTRGEWDRDRLWQLIANLTGNALHHGVRGTPVRILIDGSEPALVQLEVANQGLVPPALLGSIFEPLKNHGDRRQPGSSGLGLGLFISHQIALAHQGSIVMSSGRQDGTRVRVRLPRRAPPEGDAPVLGAPR